MLLRLGAPRYRARWGCRVLFIEHAREISATGASVLFFVGQSRLGFSLNVLGFSSATFRPPLREKSTHSEVFFGWDTFSNCFGQRFLRRGSFFNIWSRLVMQVIEESIDVKSMKPSLLTRQLVRMIALAHEDTELCDQYGRGGMYF